MDLGVGPEQDPAGVQRERPPTEIGFEYSGMP